MKPLAFQRRQVSALVLLLSVALAALAFSLGPLKSWFEIDSQMKRLEQLVEGQRSIIARSNASRNELSNLGENAGLQDQLLQGKSLNMASTQAQATLTSLVEENGGKILRVANANIDADNDSSLKPILTSVYFECDDQSLNDILYAIEFGTINFVIDRADLRSRQGKTRGAASQHRTAAPAGSLVVRIDVRGFWQRTSVIDG